MHEILTPIFGGLAATLGYLLWHARREIGTLQDAADVAEIRADAAEIRAEFAETSATELRSQLERWQARAVETSATIETLTREATELRKGARVAVAGEDIKPGDLVTTGETPAWMAYVVRREAFDASLRALAEREAK